MGHCTSCCLLSSTPGLHLSHPGHRIDSCVLQAYALGLDSSQHLAARQEVQSQLHSPEGAVVPVCLVCDRVSEDTAASEDYHQFGFGEISLQVGLLEEYTVTDRLPCCNAASHLLSDHDVVLATIAVVMIAFTLSVWSMQAVLEQDRDLQHHQLPMLDAEQHHVGDLIVTVRAVEAFRSMHA